MARQGKYTVHVVEMVRNNGIAEMVNKYPAHFFMFDYFDVLYHRELTDTDKSYEKYLSIQDPFENYQNYKVSYKVLSLYQKNNIEVNVQEDPFEPYDGEGLSDTPFIGIIQITLCKENYKDSKKENDIEGFLSECEKSICRVIEEYVKEKEKYKIKERLYRSSATGDFCLVLRTDSVETIYKIMLALNATQFQSNGIKLFAYANVGMECKSREDGQYYTLSNDFIARYPNLTFALRFSAASQFKELLEQYNKQAENGKIEVRNVKGLFGRYGYLLNINTAEFAEIYPVLCEKKLGALAEHSNAELHGEHGTDSSTKLSLLQIIRKSFAQNINERILINLSNLEVDNHWDMPIEQEDKGIVIKKNEEMFRKITHLNCWRKYYTEEHREFQELFRCMKELCKAFLPTGMEKDEFINWIVFRNDMGALCDCINEEMRSYEKMLGQNEQELKKCRARLLQHWRANIQAINQYTRLVQNVNYQTYQSPIYEIQTQIDTEKALVAYREVMENYMLLYSENAKTTGDKKDTIFTFIYPEVAESSVKVGTLFAPRMNTETMQRAIFCVVPSSEYFGRLYDLLPWLMHECSHQIRILGREARNKFIVEDILFEVFKIVIFRAFASISEDVMYGKIDQWGSGLIEDMAKTANNVIFSDGQAKQDDFERICNRIVRYLSRLFKEEGIFLEEEEKSTEDYTQIKTKIVKALLEAGRSNGLIDETYLNLMKIIKDDKSALKENQAIIKILLESYNQELQKELKYSLEDDSLVSLEDLMIPIDELDRRLSGKIQKINSEMPNGMENKNALKNYCFSVKKLHRIQMKYKSIIRGSKTEEDTIKFLTKVFERYQDRQKQEDNQKDNSRNTVFMDPSTIFIMRNLGLLNGEEDKFCSVMKEFIRETSMDKVQKIMAFKTRQYREICADMFMAISLNMGSFGYCRQVLQTISDSRIDAKEELYSGVNNERFRLVTAVLLKEEGAEEVKKDNAKPDSKGEVHIAGQSLIDQSKVYCEYTLKRIRKTLLKSDKFKGDKQKQDLLEVLLGTMNVQLAEYLDNMTKENYKHTLLYSLLHQKSAAVPKEVAEFWSMYESIREDLADKHYQFNRLEHLCRGLQQIISGRYVIVEKRMFEHMCSVWKGAKSEKSGRCKWEETMPDCLIRPRLNVGKFFNNPQQVYTLEKDEKLENVIDFIQNYYYHNRFRIMKQVGD